VFIAAPPEFVSAGDRLGARNISHFGIFSKAVMALRNDFGRQLKVTESNT
jgi:hypothetical protein